MLKIVSRFELTCFSHALVETYPAGGLFGSMLHTVDIESNGNIVSNDVTSFSVPLEQKRTWSEDDSDETEVSAKKRSRDAFESNSGGEKFPLSDSSDNLNRKKSKPEEMKPLKSILKVTVDANDEEFTVCLSLFISIAYLLGVTWIWRFRWS